MVPFLIWLLCVGIAALVIGFCIRYMNINIKEGFSTNPIVITSCPAATATYVTSAGDTNCCDGDIVDGQCNGNLLCSLSPNPGKGLLTCADWIMKEWKKRSDTFCTRSMPYYFGTMNRQHGSDEGCSASQSSPDGTAPINPMQTKCKIYQTSTDEYGKADSCFNKRALEKMAVPIPSATKEILPISQPQGKQYPALLNATYLPPNAMVPVSCYDWDRVVIFFNAVDPTGETTREWTKQYKDRHVQFCKPSKSYYVDKTLSISDAIGVPNPPPPPDPMPYDNDKNYQGSDKVKFNGRTYKLKPRAGGTGYPPNAANTIWELV